ncbi:hypothetical protein BAE44_0018696, partial [Dichanthelium oligosanthes]
LLVADAAQEAADEANFFGSAGASPKDAAADLLSVAAAMLALTLVRRRDLDGRKVREDDDDGVTSVPKPTPDHPGAPRVWGGGGGGRVGEKVTTVGAWGAGVVAAGSISRMRRRGGRQQQEEGEEEAAGGEEVVWVSMC